MSNTLRVFIENAEASGRRRGWTKLVTAVDTSKTNGYAFAGKFLNDGEHDLAIGSIVIECVPSGSARHGRKIGYAYRVSADGLVDRTRGHEWSTEFLSFRDEVAAMLGAAEEVNELEQFTTEELLAELRLRGVEMNAE